MTRPSWERYFMNFAFLAQTRSTCLKRKVGAVIIKDQQILTTGYNGPPVGVKHCRSEPNNAAACLRLGIPSGQRHELCRGLHAEQNAIIQAALHGTKIKGATLYCTNQPCLICTKMIINTRMSKVIYCHPYDDPIARKICEEVGLELVQLDFQTLP